MKHFLKVIALLILSIYITNPLLSYSGNLDTSLTGTIKSWDFSDTYTIYTGYTAGDQYLRGVIKLRKGLSLVNPNGSGTGSIYASIKVTEPIDGDIWLNGNTLILEGDIFLGRNVRIHGGDQDYNGTIEGEYEPGKVFSMNLTSWPLIMKDYPIWVTGKIYGNGNGLTIDEASGGKLVKPFYSGQSLTLSNIVLTNLSETTYGLSGGNPLTLDNAKIFINQNPVFKWIYTIYIQGITQFIGDEKTSVTLQGSTFHILPQSELRFDQGINVIFEPDFVGPPLELGYLPSACSFSDKSSMLTINNSTVTFNRGPVAHQQTNFGFTSGTININGKVNFDTDRTDGYTIKMGDGTVVGNTDLRFGVSSRLAVNDYIDLQIRSPK